MRVEIITSHGPPSRLHESDPGMRIAQISPLIESVPPRLYGGTERVVSYLTEELVALGHDVTLFASGDSMTNAKLVPCSSVALRLDTKAHDPIPHYMVMLDKVMRHAPKFDILHFHIDHLQFPLVREGGARSVTTLHGRQDMPDSALFYSYFRQAPVVSISHAQRGPIQEANFVGTVHHGLPLGLHRASVHPDAAISLFSDGSRRKRPGHGDPDRARGQDETEDRCQGRRGRRGLFSRREVDPLLDGPALNSSAN